MEQGPRNKAVSAASAGGFRSLVAWQKADQLASAVYRELARLRASDRWLASQAIRSAISVPANIAEGYTRGSLGDYLRFIDISRGSLGELEYYLLFLQGEALLTPAQFAKLDSLRIDTGRLLHGLWRSLKAKAKDGTWNHSGYIGEEPALYEVSPDFDSDDSQ